MPDKHTRCIGSSPAAQKLMAWLWSTILNKKWWIEEATSAKAWSTHVQVTREVVHKCGGSQQPQEARRERAPNPASAKTRRHKTSAAYYSLYYNFRISVGSPVSAFKLYGQRGGAQPFKLDSEFTFQIFALVLNFLLCLARNMFKIEKGTFAGLPCLGRARDRRGVRKSQEAYCNFP